MSGKESKPVVIVVCGLIEEHGSYLLTQRSATMNLPFQWEFPGGKLEDGEGLNTAIERELNEELAVKVKSGNIWDAVVYESEHIVLNLIPIECEIVSGNIVLTEHMNMGWFTPSEMQALDLASPDIPIMQTLMNKGKNIN